MDDTPSVDGQAVPFELTPKFPEKPKRKRHRSDLPRKPKKAEREKPADKVQKAIAAGIVDAEVVRAIPILPRKVWFVDLMSPRGIGHRAELTPVDQRELVRRARMLLLQRAKQKKLRPTPRQIWESS